MKHALPTIMAISLLALLAAGCDMSATNAAPSPVHSYQLIEGFYNPSSCAFSPDGKYLYVTNETVAYCDESLFGKQHDLVQLVQGSISRLNVNETGRASLTERTYIMDEGTNDVAVLPKATTLLPAGTIFVADGPEILIHDATNGNKLGQFPVFTVSGTSIDANNQLDKCSDIFIDNNGDLYLTTFYLANLRTPIRRLLRIPHATIDTLMAGKPIEGISSIQLPATGRAIIAHDSRLYVSLDGDPENSSLTGVYSVPAGNLDKAKLTTVVRGLGVISGIAFTPAGTMIMSRPESEDLFVLDADGQAGRNLPLGFPLQNPRNLAIHTLPDGSSLLAVPQLRDTRTSKDKTSPVLLLRLPAGF